MGKYDFRLIKRCEIKEASKLVAQSFLEYPIYPAMFGEDDKLFDKIYRFYRFSIFLRRKYIYVNDDLSFIGSIKYPNSKESSIIRPLFNIPTFFAFLPMFKKKFIDIYLESSRCAKESRDKFYDPKKDVFVEFVCIKKEERSGISFFKVYETIHKDEPMYIETAVPLLVKLYSRLGFKEVGTYKFLDLETHCMHLDGKNNQ